jgi:hypothetical protein
MKLFCVLISLILTGCAALNAGWYKPGASQQEFAQDQFVCMSGSQMQVSTSNVNGTGATYYGAQNTTCNTYGSTTNCSTGGGYSQPGSVSGSSASYTTTNMPLLQACMRAKGYVWTNQAEVQRYEASQQAQSDTAAQAETDRMNAEFVRHQLDRAVAGAASAAAAGISQQRYAAAQARCRAKAGDNEPLCNELDANDVIQSEAIAAKQRERAVAGAAAAAAAGISDERYFAAQARCRGVAGDNEPVCNELDAHDVIQSEKVAARQH